MKSSHHGTSTSDVEIIKVSKRGIRIRVTGTEYYLDYSQFPWFERASIEQVSDVRLLHGTHLFWEQLDVDLDIKSIRSPQDYPLISK